MNDDSPASLPRLAGIEETQRATCRGAKQRDFLRFARRKWLASDLAAESVQRVFRGHIGRRRAALNAEVRRLTGEARTEWVEVRHPCVYSAEYADSKGLVARSSAIEGWLVYFQYKGLPQKSITQTGFCSNCFSA